MDLKAGSRWRSAACDVEVVVVRAPSEDVTLECSGAPMLPHGEARPTGLSPSPEWLGGSALGKRFVHPASGLELLVVKAGEGSLAADGVGLELKGAKPLPSSD